MRELSCLTLSLFLLPLAACDDPQSCDADCSNETSTGTESGDGDGDASGDGDGDASGDGDGDASGDGDGDAVTACSGDAPIVVLETNLGTMVVQLDAVRAPISVANFLSYVDIGFYDGTIFHRVINNFVLQGGGFEPGLVEKETMGTIPLEIHPELRHVDGAIAMARSQEPDTAESQWYITDGAQGGLDDNYAVFGVLIDGFDVRNAISSVPTTTMPWMDFELGDVPIDDVVLSAAYCVEDWP